MSREEMTEKEFLRTIPEDVSYCHPHGVRVEFRMIVRDGDDLEVLQDVLNYCRDHGAASIIENVPIKGGKR